MLGKRLSESMSGIGDDLIADAMEYRAEKKRNVWLRVAAAAAVVALVIGMTAALWPQGEEPGEQMGMPTVGTTVAPTELPTTLPDVPTAPTETQGYELVKLANVLKVYACDNENATEEELKKFELTDTIESYKTMIAPYSQIYGGPIPFIFRFPEDHFAERDMSFYISVEDGWFFTEKDGATGGLCKELRFENGDKIYWVNGSVSDAIELHGSGWRFYAHILIFADEEIVGYGIIEFAFYNPDIEGAIPTFVTEEFTTVCFPMVKGEFQEVTEEYVWEQIEEYKKMRAELKGV